MRLRNKPAAALLSFVLIICRIAGTVSASDDPAPDASSSGIVSGTFNYMPAFTEGPFEATYYYSDDYFTQSGKTDNEHLATMSFDLALSTFEDDDDSFVTNLLAETGFEDIATTDMHGHPTDNSIGSAIAHKKIGDKELVAVAVRGARYTSEWASNLNAGKRGNAKGFQESCDKILGRLSKYINDYGLTGVKIWMVGYSRAGAVSNLAGVYLNEHPEDFHTVPDDLYIYTFEAPAACESDAVYDNIYNYANRNDPIPLLYPSFWGLHVNGRKILYGDDDELIIYALKDASLQEVNHFNIRDLMISAVNAVSAAFSRKEYSSLQGLFCMMISAYYSMSPEEQKDFVNNLRSSLVGRLFSSVKAPAVLEGLLESSEDSGQFFVTQPKTEDMLAEEVKTLQQENVGGSNGIRTDVSEAVYKLGAQQGRRAGRMVGKFDAKFQIKRDDTPDEFVRKDWMTDDYENGFLNGYKKGYNSAYDNVEDDAEDSGTAELKDYSPYNVLTELVSNHYPQNNIKLMEARDSYYQK